jgi:hypothetical protein
MLTWAGLGDMTLVSASTGRQCGRLAQPRRGARETDATTHAARGRPSGAPYTAIFSVRPSHLTPRPMHDPLHNIYAP